MAIGLSFFAGMVQVHGQSFLTNGLIAYYPFNGNAIDGSGNGYDGVVSSNSLSVADRFNHLNHAMFFGNDPSSAEENTARIDIPAAALDSLTSGTISAWINPKDVTFTDIIAKQHNGANSYGVFSIGAYSGDGGGPTVGNPGTLYFHSQNYAPLAASTATVVAQTWQHVTVVFTQSYCSFYINGILCGTTAGDFSIPEDLSPDSTTIGCWRGDGWGSGQQSISAIDDVRIYNRALSANEVSQLYNAEKAPNGSKPDAQTGKAIYVKVSNMTIGYSYQLQQSVNGNHWMNSGSPFTALTTEFIYGFQVVDDHQHLSFRLVPAY